MNIKLDDILTARKVYNVFLRSKNVYLRQNTDIEFSEKIRYKMDAPDWLIYIDGNTIRNLVRGFAFCSSGMVFCDDNGQNFKISIESLKNVSVSSTNKSVLINGKCVTLGEISKIIAENIILIKRDLSVVEKEIRPIKIANLTEVLWYVGYNGEIQGPFSQEQLQEKINKEEYEIELLQVWNQNMCDWELVVDVSEFDLPKERRLERNAQQREQIDINQCSLEQLIQLPGISENKAKRFFDKREYGLQLRNIYDFQKEFDLKPHELEKIQHRIIFRARKNWKDGARRLDM